MKAARLAPEDRGYKTPCLIYTGKLSPPGYGPYRNIYLKSKGEIPEGMHLDHLCRVRACCNPEHLQPVTPKENARRRMPHVRDGGLADTDPPFWLSPPALNFVRERSSKLGVSQAAVIELAVRKLARDEFPITLGGEQ